MSHFKKGWRDLALAALLLLTLGRSAFAEGPPATEELILQLNLARADDEVPGGSSMINQVVELNPNLTLVQGVLAHDPNASKLLIAHPNAQIRGLILTGDFHLRDHVLDNLLKALRPRFGAQLNLIILTPRPYITDGREAVILGTQLMTAAGADGTVFIGSPRPFQEKPSALSQAPEWQAFAMVVGGASLAVVAQNLTEVPYLVASAAYSVAAYVGAKTWAQWWVQRRIQRRNQRREQRPALPAAGLISLVGPLVAKLSMAHGVVVDPVVTATFGVLAAKVINSGLIAKHSSIQFNQWSLENYESFYHRGWRVVVKDNTLRAAHPMSLENLPTLVNCEEDLLKKYYVY